ncbi:FAD-binding oxidoreductase [Nonlabens sp. MB-3u-79]|uniref:NAD(P)/FAD-dependent oxidoreductase n=1 Tax=Nonlabens sp. MB-3u-79 TaxID=2058134 RepID=UPI000C301E8C|nr:FAD-dependent oxidoreductase [Nonlabens sp. MB-3u-79]AUC79101.1 FAD-binding oxidoreductase [Nonlabens sp. MB-3u-79]|tara:strand:+ start:6289 stop:7341 length:1053 start_codon:yes stop_codon:yes gene_type:complete
MNTKVDIIIVGSGIAGCTLAWQWLLQGKSVMMIADGKKGSSAVAAGVYNPTILKRFTSVWKAVDQLEVLNDFYPRIEALLDAAFLHPTDILRRFHDEREIKTWKKKAVKEDLNGFMSEDTFAYENPAIHAPFDYGKVSGTGWVDTSSYMELTIDYLQSISSYRSEDFDFMELRHYVDHVVYKESIADRIIFAEGFQMLSNPFFNNLPLEGNKGEVFTIKVPDLQLDYIIKSSVFLMPFTDDLFWVGATYNRDDVTDAPTLEAKEFLTSRLERFLKLPYEIVEHKYGIRPTTKDRRPFVGAHKEFKNYMVFNGMGSRAVLMAPWAAQQLFDSIYKDHPLDSEIDIQRFNEL